MYKKPAMTYFKDEDILHLLISEGVEASSIEVAPNITVELNAEGDILGIEILNASSFLRDTIMDTVQGKLIQSDQEAA